MTLTTTEQVPEANAQSSVPQFLVFFSSGTPPWCPDCVDALPHVRTVFETDPKTNTAEAHLVLVGQRAEWKTPENSFRKQYGISSIPTITKVVKGKEVGRLEDDKCKDTATIRQFVLE